MHVSPVDLVRYPLDQPASTAYTQLSERCAASFATNGVALLPGFLTDAGLQAMNVEAEHLVDLAYFCRSDHNVYLDAGDVLALPGSARNRQLQTNVGSIANDYLDPAGSLQQLYNSDWLASFVARVVGVERLFPSADPLGAVSINVFAPGDSHGWHFDESLFTVTLMVQEAEVGGHFEYVTGLRSECADDLDGIAAVLDGVETNVQRLPFRAGTLSIFRGRHTMHRVATIGGSRHRLVPVLTYATEPGYENSVEVRKLFWGRTASDSHKTGVSDT